MDELEIDGKKYLSSKRAAREHKYHIDYIGQLIRAGRVAGRKVGRSWYVEEASLKEYLISEGNAPAAPQAPKEVAPQIAAPVPIPETPAPAVETPISFSRARYVEEKIEQQPTPAAAPQTISAESVHHRPVMQETREVYFSAPVSEKKQSALRYVEDDEPMLPVLKRANADFVAVPVRKVVEERAQAEQERDEEEAEIEEAHVTVVPKMSSGFSFKKARLLVGIAVVVFALAAISSSLLATSIKVSEGSAASVGVTVK
jgi:hypothetical protein